MRQIIKALAFIAGLVPAIAAAQQFNTIPANTVIGRLGTSAGPAQALPLSTVFSTSIFDQLSTTPGAIPYRGAGSWTALAPSAGLLYNNATTPSYKALPLTIPDGGTGQTTAAGARASAALNIDQYTGHGDSSYTILSTDRTVGTTAAFTAARSWTLPAANSINPGQTIMVADYFGGVSSTNNLTIQRSGSDTINGSTSATITTAYGRVELRSDGVSKWSISSASASQSLVSILNYGARCDGATDDSTAMQTWLNALPTVGRGVIPAGLTCLYSGIITVPSSAFWQMYGAILKIKNSGASLSCICFGAADLLSPGATFAGVSGGTFDGNRVNQSGSGGTSPLDIRNAHFITIRDVTVKESKTGVDCIAIGGNTTNGLAGNILLDNVHTTTGCGRNGLAMFGVNIVSVVHSSFAGATIASPFNGIDLEPDSSASPDMNVTIDDVVVLGNSGCGIQVNPAAISGAVTQGQAMNITGIGNTGDFCQYTTPATKAGFRFINAHGTFGGTLPAVDALP